MDFCLGLVVVGDSGCVMWFGFMVVGVWFVLCLDLACVGCDCGVLGFWFWCAFHGLGFAVWGWLLCCWFGVCRLTVGLWFTFMVYGLCIQVGIGCFG